MRKILMLMLGVFALCTQLLAQTRTVTGRVTDNQGNGLPNVSVQVRGTNTGTVSTADGSYSLNVPANATLVFSSVDMATREMAVGDQTTINVSLTASNTNLQEVVVTSFGIRRDRRTLGYSVSQLNTEEVTQAHTTNITNALAGKIPGVRISGSGGSFSGSSIIIRGFNTFTGNNQPLFVVDGIPIDNSGGGIALQTGPVNSNRAIDINQEDIETISVLKGPSAAALYGSRAANGVILITTKKGRIRTKSSIEYSTNYQVEEVNRYPELQNTYAQGLGGAFNGISSSSWGPEIKGQMVNQYNPETNQFNRAAPLAAFPNNVEDIFQNGYNWQNNIAFSGGGERSTFRFSYGYLRNEGVINNNLLNRHNFTINTSSGITKKLTATLSGTYTNNFSKRTVQGNSLSSPLFRGWFLPRSYDLKGLAFENVLGEQRFPMGEDHPYWTIKHNRFNDEINRLFGSVGFNLKLIDWLQADLKVGTDIYSTFRHGYDQVGGRGQANINTGGAGGVFETRNQFRSFNTNFFLTATKRFNDFNVTAILGNEVSQINNRTATSTGRGIVVRDFEQLSNTQTIATPAIGSSKVRLIGVFGDVAVGYKSYANLTGTLRSDWSSTFTEGNNQYFYPSVGGSLNITEIFPNLKNNVINNIRVRGNVSKVGKAGADFVYSTDSYFGSIIHADGFGPQKQYPFNGLQSFSFSNAAGSPELGPEFTTNKEIGLVLGFFDNRLTFDGTIYRQKSTDLIFGVPYSNTSGLGSVVRNAGDLSTKGIELGINGTPIRSSLVTWDINVNFTKFESKVERLAVGVQNIFLAGFTTPNIRLVEGDEYGQIYGNAFQKDAKTGKMIVGANGLPLITSGVEKIGNPNPKFLLGITNTVNIKGFNLSFLIDYREGGDIYSRNIADIQRNGAAKETAEFARYDASGVATKPYLFDAVYADGTPNTTNVTAEQYWGNSGKFAAAEGFIFGTTWFRIREASIGYKIPSSLLSKTPFGNADLSVFGRNLYLNAPDYPHLDPEQNVLGVSSAQGLEFNALPQTRSVGVSLRITF
ncbi:MAG: SusC/RagA family TonB-linked outer membrane protein [Bacteroidota bacterium]|nr:SusC/RagA family TonB-linked outer membrane protein [Bacteroidota bacterium]